MSEHNAYPLEWPVGQKRTPDYRRKHSKFGGHAGRRSLTFDRCRDDLFDELGRLGAKGVILSTNMHLRLDGIPYANQRQPKDPGVAVYFTRMVGESHRDRKLKGYVIACDQYEKIEENTRAITVAIDAIRRIERHCPASMLEQAFKGFEALPPSPGEDWRSVFGFSPGDMPSIARIEALYRAMVPKVHPDRGGSVEAMTMLNVAYDAAKREVGP